MCENQNIIRVDGEHVSIVIKFSMEVVSVGWDDLRDLLKKHFLNILWPKQIYFLTISILYFNDKNRILQNLSPLWKGVLQQI